MRYMRIGCMQSTLWPISMTILIWNDLMTSQHDNLSRGSPRLMTSDRQILYPHIPLAVTPLVALRLMVVDLGVIIVVRERHGRWSLAIIAPVLAVSVP